MSRFTMGVLTSVMLVCCMTHPVCAAHGVEQVVWNDLVLSSRDGRLVEALARLEADGAAVEGSGLHARLAAYTGLATLIEMVELGEASPLRATVSPGTWDELVKNLPIMVLVRARLVGTLLDEVAATLAGGSTELTRQVVTGSGALLAGTELTDELLRQGSLLFGSKGLLALVTYPGILLKLGRLAIRADVGADVRREARALIAAVGLLKAKLLVAENAYRDRLGLPAVDGTTGEPMPVAARPPLR